MRGGTAFWAAYSQAMDAEKADGDDLSAQARVREFRLAMRLAELMNRTIDEVVDGGIEPCPAGQIRAIADGLAEVAALEREAPSPPRPRLSERNPRPAVVVHDQIKRKTEDRHAPINENSATHAIERPQSHPSATACAMNLVKDE